MSALTFTIKTKDKTCRARTGLLQTPQGIIHTPEFVPVATQASVKSLTNPQLKELNSQILMINTYHMFQRPGADFVAQVGGLHKFMAWDRPIMTDSGGFQIFSFSNTKEGVKFVKVFDDKLQFRSPIDHSWQEFTPEDSIALQEKLGADIIFALDECIPFESEYETAKKSLARTHAWAQRCINAHKRTDQGLFGIVQGGRFKDLREESARFLSSLPFAGFGIGSIFGEPKEETYQVLKWTMEALPENKPVHLLGIGAVDDLFAGVEVGIDLFDCVLPTRLARVGYIFSSECNKSTKWRYRLNAAHKANLSPLDKNCSCYTCKHHTKAYLLHLFKADELSYYTLATYHNLAFFSNLMKQIRESIENGTFQELKAKWLA